MNLYAVTICHSSYRNLHKSNFLSLFRCFLCTCMKNNLLYMLSKKKKKKTFAYRTNNKDIEVPIMFEENRNVSEVWCCLLLLLLLLMYNRINDSVNLISEKSHHIPPSSSSSSLASVSFLQQHCRFTKP